MQNEPKNPAPDDRRQRHQRAIEAIDRWSREHPGDDDRLGELLQQELATDRGIRFHDDAERERCLLEDSDAPWTDELNARRCLLIDRELNGELTAAEKAELDGLQERMLRHRDQTAPLPLDAARQLHAELVARTSRPPQNG